MYCSTLARDFIWEENISRSRSFATSMQSVSRFGRSRKCRSSYAAATVVDAEALPHSRHFHLRGLFWDRFISRVRRTGFHRIPIISSKVSLNSCPKIRDPSNSTAKLSSSVKCASAQLVCSLEYGVDGSTIGLGTAALNAMRFAEGQSASYLQESDCSVLELNTVV